MDSTLLPQFPPAWLTRPAEIRAHLRAAAFEHGMVELELGPLRMCAMLHPDGIGERSFEVVPISPLPRELLPAQAPTFQVHYGDALTRCQFLTTLRTARPAEPWILELPRAIERRERRVAPRISVAGLGVRLELGPRVGGATPGGPAGNWQTVDVIDISALGLAFRSRARLHPGDRVSARLRMTPESVLLQPVLELRGERPDPEEPALQVYGCEFSGLGPSGYDALDRDLAALRNLS